MNRPRSTAGRFGRPAIVVFSLIVGPATLRAGVPYQACGELVNTGGFPPCVVHVADDGVLVRPLNLGDFEAGDRVVVNGTIDPMTASLCNSQLTPNLAGNTIERCFAECGTIVEVEGCYRFDSDRGGSFVVLGADFYEDGARVFVSGIGVNGVAQCGGESLPNIDFPTIAPCTSRTGRIVRPFGCSYLLTGDGQGYDFANFADFQDGDYVTIEGDASLGAFGACGYPLIERNTIKPAFGGSGTLVASPDCGLIFRPDATDVATDFSLENTAAFNAGDRVVVTGRIDDGCESTGACTLPCITANTIGALSTACGTFDIGTTECLVFTPDDGGDPFLIEYSQLVNFGVPVFVAGTFREPAGLCDNEGGLDVMRDNLFLECIDVCGEFVGGFECTPLFSADDGQIYWVENLGGYGEGDRARVVGGRGGFCNGLCPFPCIRVNAIGPCDEIPGDVNGNGDVDTDDVQLFVAVLLGVDDDPYRVLVSDVNLDGTPDGDDVQPFTLIVLGLQ